MKSTSSAAQAELDTIAGRYRTERVLGRGGMGAVYAAFDPVRQKRIAIKVLTHASAGVTALFEREYRTLASLKHPHIVEVYDFGKLRDGCFYSMELLEGSDLSELAPLPWREVCRCLRDAASTLGVLHVRGLIHRDLSPRNLWRLPNGQLKLIDFGALAPFGKPSEIMGTPPLVPPEAVHREALDQRADLYSLGALGYWLLTGAHAYAAQSLADLPALWARPPAAPSVLLDLVASPHERPPASLEALLMQLMQLDPTQRIGSCAELIDRLNTIAGLAPESDHTAAQGYLESKAFVGRARERDRLNQLLSEVEQGHVRSLFIEGPSGIGRSRLLDELSVQTRVAGALTLVLEAPVDRRPYGLAAQLAVQLLTLLPGEAERAIGPHAGNIRLLSPRLAELLPERSSDPTPHQAEQRLRTQTALQTLLLELSTERVVALIVDDLQAVDEESQALLSVLARTQDKHKLLIVSATLREGSAELASPLQTLRSASTRLLLLPLTSSETLELLRTVFGKARYLERLAERLFRLSDGNPGYCLELCQQLVHGDVVRYADGGWLLPTDLSEARLPKTRTEGLAARLHRLSAPARQLGQHLSVPHHGALSFALCMAASPLPEGETRAALRALHTEGVLKQTGDDYSFTHELLRESLLQELPAAQRSATHLKLAEALRAGAGNDPLEQLRASIHYLHGGALTQGERILRDRARNMMQSVEPPWLSRAVPMLEEGVALLRRHGRDDYALMSPLAVLACCGYFVHRRLARQYGAPTIAALAGVLKLGLARRLRGLLGAKLALIVALCIAGCALFVRRGRSLKLVEAIRLLITSASSLAGATALSLDPAAARSYADAIEPLCALGEDHAACFVHRFTMFLALRSTDRIALGRDEARRMVAHLQSDRPIHGMLPSIREGYLAGALFSLGAAEASHDGPESLAVASRLDQFSVIYQICADQVRSSYHANRGNMVEAARYRQLVETRTIQLGNAWQVDTWGALESVKTSMRTQDAMAMKRTAQELARLREEMPCVEQAEHTARAAYLVMRGKFKEAVEELRGEHEPRAIIGWARSQGVLASAYNGLGQHERALAVCRAAYALMDEGDFELAPATLNLQIELVMSLAKLGDHEAAARELDTLRARHLGKGSPLTVGAVHETAARVALAAGELNECERALELAEAAYRPSGIVTLVERLMMLRVQLERARHPEQEGADLKLLMGSAQLVSRVQLLLTHAPGERALKALQIALELSGADDGFLVLQGQDQAPSAFLKEAPEGALVRAAQQRLMAAYSNDETAVVDQVDTLIDLALTSSRGLRYCFAPLWARRQRQDVVVAVLALGFGKGEPSLPSADVLRVIGGSLVEAVSEASVTG